MHRIPSILILGTIAASSALTFLISVQTQKGQCAEFSLPLNFQFAIGDTCHSR